MRSPALRLLLLTILVSPAAWGQASNVTVTTVTAPVDILTVSDVDFVNTTTPKWLFTINLTAVPAGSTLEVVLRIEGRIRLSSGASFEDPPAVRLVSRPLTVVGTRSLTNLDFRDPALRQSYDLSGAAEEEFKRVALPTSAMPAGTYNFRVTVEQQSREIGSGEFTFVLTNPSSIDLFFPVDGETLTGPLPLFQWRFDGPRARISIFEQLPGQTGLEETASGVPFHVAEAGAGSYQYPSSGVRSLRPGATYVWFVEGLSRLTGGQEKLMKSQLRSFTVAASAASALSVLDELERALGPRYKPLFDQIRAEGFEPTGAQRIDGAPLSALDLLSLIAAFRARPELVSSAGLE